MGVLEVGPGLGCLTAELSKRAEKVLAVEADRRLQPLLGETLDGCENVEIRFGDIMKQDLKTLVAEGLKQQERRILCANLPYQITGPFLTKAAESGCFETVCVMIQKEVAERICAEPGGKDYGAFSLRMQYAYEPELLFSVAPHCFMPQPKVTSAVIRMRRRSEPPCRVADEQLLFRVIRGGFSQRRKTLLNALTSALPELGKGQWEELLDYCGIDIKVRAETLNLVDFARICNEFSRRTEKNL